MTGSYTAIQNTLRPNNDSDVIEYFMSFPDTLRFQCLPDCGLCCSSYKIPLTRSDVDRLNKDNSGDITGSDIAGFINNGGEETGCPYLSVDLTCGIYEHRPLYCRTFPFIRDSYFTLEMSVDYSCPGIGHGKIISNDYIKKMFMEELSNRNNGLNIEESLRNHSFAVSALKSRNIFTEHECLTFMSNELIKKCLSYNRPSTIARCFELLASNLDGALQNRGNILTRAAAEKTVGKVDCGRSLSPGVSDQSDGPLFSNIFPLDNRPLKISLFDEEIPHYELSFTKNGITISGISGGSFERQLSFSDIKSGEIVESALRMLSEYLTVWLSRQSLLRLTHSMALASLQRSNIFKSYFEFITLAAERVLSTAEALRILNKEEIISESSIREAIRANDNVLRGKCLSMITVN